MEGRSADVLRDRTGQRTLGRAHHGVDQLTLEARAYGVARAFDPFLVNSVVGFIGPEYLYDERQIIRAGLEDHFMGKLLGLPMGCDVCYTNHAAADQNSADNLLFLLTAAGCNYFMGVPCSRRCDAELPVHELSRRFGCQAAPQIRPAPEFLTWLQKMGIYHGEEPAFLYVQARRRLLQGLEASSGEHLMTRRTDDFLLPGNQPELVQKIRARTPARLLEGRAGAAYRTGTQMDLRLAHANARDAVRTELDTSGQLGVEFVKQWNLLRSTQASSKDGYPLNPSLGRCFSEASRAELLRRCATRNDLQIAIGDGLSVTAVIAQVPTLLPALYDGAKSRGWTIGEVFVIRHCRVGILNEIGDLLAPTVAVLLIGERPGLATDESLSAYMAYKPRMTQTDANRNLVSNIHARGVSPTAAAVRILDLQAAQMMQARSSGARLTAELEEPERST